MLRVLLCQGEGLILSTPRGSTALSAAAGASLVHPLVPALLATPLCPAPSVHGAHTGALTTRGNRWHANKIWAATIRSC